MYMWEEGGGGKEEGREGVLSVRVQRREDVIT